MTRLAERYGWRGLWLMVMGTTWCFFGVGVLLSPSNPEPWVLHQQIPVELRAAAWFLTGLFATWTGSRGPDRDDSLGHVALYVMPAVQLASFAVAWLIYVATSAIDQVNPGVDVTGYRNGWYSALIWLLVSTMLAVTARWPNPDPALLPEPPNGQGARS